MQPDERESVSLQSSPCNTNVADERDDESDSRMTGSMDGGQASVGTRRWPYEKSAASAAMTTPRWTKPNSHERHSPARDIGVGARRAVEPTPE